MELVFYTVMQLHRAGYIEFTEMGFRLFAVNEKYHTTLDELLEGQSFRVMPWENGYYDDNDEDPFFCETELQE